jgi:hypothetical protein
LTTETFQGNVSDIRDRTMESNVSPKDVLGVLIRAFGLLVAVYGIYEIFFSIVETMGLTSTAQFPPSRHAMFGTIYWVFGLIIVRTADLVSTVAYGRRRDLRDQDTGEEGKTVNPPDLP